MRRLFARWRSGSYGAVQTRPAKIILGLGNPGPEHAHQRHNAGFHCVDALAKSLSIRFTEGHRFARLAEAQIGGKLVVLAKPNTFVNRSGEAAAALMQRYRTTTDDLVVIYDELDLPLGRIRIREKGSSGGHNGLKSIIDHLHSQDFPRIRVGIDRPANQYASLQADERAEAVIRWVLTNFTAQEEALMAEVRLRVVDAVRCILDEGTTAAMNRFNTDKNPL